MKLSQRTISLLSRDYHKKYKLRPFLVDLNGRCVSGKDMIDGFPAMQQVRANAIQESFQWGTPGIFLFAPSVISWVVALEHDGELLGGIAVSGVIAESVLEDKKESLMVLRNHGMSRTQAEGYIDVLQVWPEKKITEAAVYLMTIFYQMSGWKSKSMREKAAQAQQQRQIAESIQERKKTGMQAFASLEAERYLFSLIRAGNRNAAREVLNKILGNMFLRSPNLAVLRARSIELLGYLSRTAIEYSPELERMMEQNVSWMAKLVESNSFESICEILTMALDEFMGNIQLRGYEKQNPAVSKAVDYIASHYMEQIKLAEVARIAGLSPFRLAHLLKKMTGRTMLETVQHLRITKAQQLLDRTSKSCAEIAYEVGYSDQSYFTRHFRKIVGGTPRQYRKR